MGFRLNSVSKIALAGISAGLIPFASSLSSAQPIGADGPNFFMTQYYDVATSTLPSASGYGGKGASGGIGDGLVRIVNGGDAAPEQRGTVCAMIYVFDDLEEMRCGCPVTPDGLRTLSVINNLTKNFGVNRGNMNAGVVDILSVDPNLFLPKPVPLSPQLGLLGSSGWACDPTFQLGPELSASRAVTFGRDKLKAWETHTEANAPVPATRESLVKGVSLNEFQFAPLDDAHFLNLTNFCLFLITNGSGTGACSCGSGDSFSKAPQPTPVDTQRN